MRMILKKFETAWLFELYTAVLFDWRCHVLPQESIYAPGSPLSLYGLTYELSAYDHGNCKPPESFSTFLLVHLPLVIVDPYLFGIEV